MIVYERTKFPKLAKPLLIDRLIVILEKYRGKGIDENMTWYTARGTFISSELDAGTPITHVAEMAGNSARTIEKHYYKNTKQEKLYQRMNARYGSWEQ
ncbi:MAG: hypothetical protein ACI3ZQ_00850 [Candidatus Cryptobacteroides sp.]